MRLLLTLVLIVLAVSLVACGEESDSGGGDSADAPAPKKPDCKKAAPKLVKTISVGLEVDGGGSLRRAHIVRSDDYKRAYFVSADIQGPSLDGPDDVGTWVTNRPDGSVGVLAVDGFANQFSDWGDGRKTDADFSITDDGAEESRECVTG